MALKELNANEIAALLESPTGRGGGRVKKDVTEPRERVVWFKLYSHIREEGCENPDCMDNEREKDKDNPKYNRGVRIVSEVKGKFMCRYCFLGGWLSDATPAGTDND